MKNDKLKMKNTRRQFENTCLPCRYTAEEIKTSSKDAIRQRKEGQYTSHEDMAHLINTSATKRK
jgi:hypothetical protein